MPFSALASFPLHVDSVLLMGVWREVRQFNLHECTRKSGPELYSALMVLITHHFSRCTFLRKVVGDSYLFFSILSLLTK